MRETLAILAYVVHTGVMNTEIIGQTITVKHLAWGTLTGQVKTLHKNGKSGTLSVSGHASAIAFRLSDVLA